MLGMKDKKAIDQINEDADDVVERAEKHIEDDEMTILDAVALVMSGKYKESPDMQLKVVKFLRHQYDHYRQEYSHLMAVRDQMDLAIAICAQRQELANLMLSDDRESIRQPNDNFEILDALMTSEKLARELNNAPNPMDFATGPRG